MVDNAGEVQKANNEVQEISDEVQQVSSEEKVSRSKKKKNWVEIICVEAFFEATWRTKS